jgi:hypothetical protein
MDKMTTLMLSIVGLFASSAKSKEYGGVMFTNWANNWRCPKMGLPQVIMGFNTKLVYMAWMSSATPMTWETNH